MATPQVNQSIMDLHALAGEKCDAHMTHFLDAFLEEQVNIGVRQGVAMDSLKYRYGPPCLTLLSLAGRPLLKRPYGRFWGCLLPLWPSHASRLCR
jgi:hypothetical protein